MATPWDRWKGSSHDRPDRAGLASAPGDSPSLRERCPGLIWSGSSERQTGEFRLMLGGETCPILAVLPVAPECLGGFDVADSLECPPCRLANRRVGIVEEIGKGRYGF